jgi:predicted ArsR family transcriptional regulator
LHIFACPYFDVAQKHGEVCAMERQMLEEVLGGKVELEHSIREGHHRCRFVVNKEQSQV